MGEVAEHGVVARRPVATVLVHAETGADVRKV
jgi:hypothetical protein